MMKLTNSRANSKQPAMTTRLLSLSALRRQPNTLSSFLRLFSSKPTTTLVNFSLPSDDEDDAPSPPSNPIPRPLPPPYDPFNPKPEPENTSDPKDLQEVFHKMRTDGLQSSAVKMFDALSKDNLTHEALQLFAHIKDKGQMPEVVAHTAVMEAYADANKAKDALKVYKRMLACGVRPNAYTYSVLIKALAVDESMIGEAKKYLVEMVGAGMRPNAGTYVVVVEALVGTGKEDEAMETVEVMRGRGFKAEEKAVREVMKGRRGGAVRIVFDILFRK